MARPIAYQGSLFDGGPSTPDEGFTGLRRIGLNERSWVDYCPGWLRGSDELFAELVATGRFTQRTVHVYDNTVPEPRLTAGWSTAVDAVEDAVPEALRRVSESVSAHYGVEFDRVWVNLYRDGLDSVAWHGDRNRYTHRNPLVVTVSIGARRRF